VLVTFLQAMSFVHTPGDTGPEINVLKFLRGIYGWQNLLKSKFTHKCDLLTKAFLATSFMNTKAITGPEKVSCL